MPSNLFPYGVRLIDPADVITENNLVLTALNQATGTIPANIITGGSTVYCVQSNATPGTQTTRTALQLYGDDPTSLPGQNYVLRIINTGAGTLTLAGGTGVTVSGTATVATNITRDYFVAITGTPGAPVYTITSVGSGVSP